YVTNVSSAHSYATRLSDLCDLCERAKLRINQEDTTMLSLSTIKVKLAIWRMTFLLVLALLGMPLCAKADKVTDWNAIGSTAIANEGRGGTPGAIDLAYMHIAIYDAVNAIDRRFTVFAVSPSNVPPGASEEAATVEAAYRILINLFTTQATFL